MRPKYYLRIQKTNLIRKINWKRQSLEIGWMQCAIFIFLYYLQGDRKATAKSHLMSIKSSPKTLSPEKRNYFKNSPIMWQIWSKKMLTSALKVAQTAKIAQSCHSDYFSPLSICPPVMFLSLSFIIPTFFCS